MHESKCLSQPDLEIKRQLRKLVLSALLVCLLEASFLYLCVTTVPTLVGGLGNDPLNLGLNDGAVDIVRYTSGDGTDIINQFVKGSDKLAFTGIAAIDVKVSGTDTQLRLGNGIAGDTGFGSGTLFATIKGVTGFTAVELGTGGTSLDTTNTAKFLFS